ncbi:hypothetical protein F4604DRAFT_1922561 [Suillus subluteus]|nr:hypothetical protein F4604DRAFT_1922561 [Suillus subluteus]
MVQARAQCSRVKLIAAQKQEWHRQQEALTDAIDTAKSVYVQEAAHIAETHRRSLKWMHNQLFLRSRMLRQQHGVNSWNAFVRAKHKEANEDLEKGERIKLTQFIADNKTELVRAHSKLTFTEKRAYNMQVLEARQQRNRITHANPKATIHDVNATFTSMDREWMALCARTGVEGFYVAVRGGIEDLSEPKVFFTQKAEKFVKDILNVEPRHLGLKLESFIVSGLDQHTAHRQCPLNKLISECRTFIQEGLDSIALENNIQHPITMNYTNYEQKMVEHRSFALVGWPVPVTVKYAPIHFLLLFLFTCITSRAA